jgi:hypothetical protein
VSRFEDDETASAAGPSLLEMLEEDLDEALQSLMHYLDNPPHTMEGHKETARLTGVCYGLARAVGIIRSPYDPDAGLKAARGAAMLRLKANNPSQEAS